MSSLPQPDRRLAEDDGGADPELARVLAAYEAGDSDDADVLAALTVTRLIVPVAALPVETEVGPDGLAREKTVEMALPVMVGTDGRRALPAFTSVAALAAWDPAARPVPVPTQRAALGAVQEGCAFLVVDPAGPVTWVADRAQVESLARDEPAPAP
jgi:SseB protein N-terminal domain